MTPDAYYKDIFSIDYNNLKNKGIKNIFFDVDNTLIPYKEFNPSKDCKELINELKNKGFNVKVMSNSNSQRVLKISKNLGIDGYYSSMKPLKKNYKKIIKKYNKNECIFIGDQFMTDVLGAKRNNLKVILVDRINDNEPLVTKFWRFFERILLKRLKRNNKFIKYSYYDNISKI